jgi:hypothetical protein
MTDKNDGAAPIGDDRIGATPKQIASDVREPAVEIVGPLDEIRAQACFEQDANRAARRFDVADIRVLDRRRHDQGTMPCVGHPVAAQAHAAPARDLGPRRFYWAEAHCLEIVAGPAALLIEQGEAGQRGRSDKAVNRRIACGAQHGHSTHAAQQRLPQVQRRSISP